MNGATQAGRDGQQSVDYNINDIRKTFVLMRRQPDQVTELRCLHTRWKTLSAYSNNIDKLVELAVELSQRTPHVSAVYFTANPCLPSLLALYPADRIKEYADKTTPDGEIIRRYWLLIDIDPNPTAGISSTDEEHAAAQEKAKRIARFLVDHGVPANSIILGDSGNGAHVLVAIDLPSDDDSKELIDRCLEAIASRFAEHSKEIDLTCSNAARIWKVYGTMARKGADFKGNGPIPARPHRLSRLVYVPKQIEICSREALDRIAAMAPEKPQPEPRSFNGGAALDLPDFFARNGIGIKRQTAWKDNTGYELEECPFDPSHNHGEPFVAQFPSGAVSFKCHHSSCLQYKWQDVREKFEPRYRNRTSEHSRTTNKSNEDEEKPKVEDAAPTIDVPLTKNLIHELADQIRRFIFFKGERIPLLIATWTLATYVHERFQYFAILWITSPVMRCGKTRLIDILDQLVWRSSGSVVNTSLAALYYMTAEGCTFLADEVENLKNSDREQFGAVIGIVNGGFAKGATVRRMVKIEGDWVQKKFPIYGPKVLAGIATVSDTIRDRSLCIRMIRKSPKERTERLSMRKEQPGFDALRLSMTAWAEQNGESIEKIYESLKEQPELKGCDDRFLDIAEPLLSIVRFADAEAANGGKRIVDELMPLLKEMGGLRGEAQNDEAIAALCGLLDAMLGGSDERFILSNDLLAKMKETAGLEWISSTKGLGTFVGKLGLVSRQDPTGSKRGYLIKKEAVEDIRLRYILSSPDFKASEVSDDQAGRGSEGIL